VNISPLTLRASPAESPAQGKPAREQEKLAEASRQFEALLVRQILQQARQTTIRSKFTDNSASSEIYKDMVNAELADAMTKGGGLGLADSLRRQLSHQLSTADHSLSPTRPESPSCHD